MTQPDSAGAEIATALKCELASEVLRSFGTLRFAATGWSMLPSVWPGDTLVVERVRPDEVHVGDVVLVGREGRLCAHRVISAAGDSQNSRWITQGDGMSAPDRPVLENELLGRVAYRMRSGQRVPVRTELSAVETLAAKIVRRSVPAARALVRLHRMFETAEEPVLPCQS